MDIRTLLMVTTFLILVTFPQCLNSQHCSSDVFQGDDIKTTTACYYEHRQCSFSALQSVHPTLYNSMNTAWKQPNVTALKVTSFCEPDDRAINQSGLNMQWKLQDVSGSQEIKGFEIRVEGHYGGDFRCVVMALNEPITRDKINSVFTGTVSGVKRGREFRVIVISLPRTTESALPHKDVKSIVCDRGKSSDSWYVKTCMYKYDVYKQTLNVTFEEPPKVYNITEFSLSILSPQFYYKEIINSTHIVFHDVKPGNYSVIMDPYNPYRYDTDRCVCRDDEARCSTCGLSICHIEITEPVQTKVDSQTKDGNNILMALIPIIALACLFVCIIIFVKVIAPCCGVEIDLGYCFDTSDKPNLLCIDASSSSDMAATFKKLVHREFKYCHRSTINYRQLTYSSDTCNNFGQIVTEVCSNKRRNSLRSDLCCKTYEGVDQNCKKVVVCLLVKDLQQKSTSDIYCKLRIEMAQLPEVHCELIVVYSTCSSHHTVDKAFKLSDETSLISGIRNTIYEINTVADDKQPIMCERSHHMHQGGDLTSADFQNTIALPEVQYDYDPHEECYSRPDSNHLCIPENEKRGRYLSNDSGHGASPKEWNGSFNAIYEDYPASRGGQYLMTAPEGHYLPYHQRTRYMSNDSGHGTSPRKLNGSHEHYLTVRERPHVMDTAELQHLPYEQRSNLDMISWIAPSSVDDLDTCGDSVTMEYIGNEMLAINEDARTVIMGKA